MNAKEQSDGEKRVQALLIEPLELLGLGRPAGLTVSKFEDMKKNIRQRLAYMSDASLLRLRDWGAAHPGGKYRDRFPLAAQLFPEALDIQAPEGGPSPLQRDVFKHDLGREALEKGWAPELLDNITGNRNWPGAWTIGQIKKAADDPIRQLEDIELRLSRGEAIPPEQNRFRDERRAALAKCQAIRDEALKGSAS